LKEGSPIVLDLASGAEFCSNSDKHRDLRLPKHVSDALCIETGIDLGDGTRVLYHPGRRHSSYIYSISQRFPDEWFGSRFVIFPLLSELYGIPPKQRKSSKHRNGICVYLNSRGVLLFKHRILGLPVGECSRIIRTPSFVVEGGKDAMCRFVEGYQYADGSFVAGKSPCIRITSSSISIIRKFSEIADSFNVAHSLSKDHKDVGFSLRISAEDSMEKWLKHVRLLNPVQISKFLVWKRFSECPPGLFFSHYVDLLSGRRELGNFSNGFLREKQRTHLYIDSVDLVTQFVLDKQDLTFSEIA